MTVMVRNLCRFVAIVFFIGCQAIAFGQLSANFTASPLSGCSPLVVNFRDSSQGSPNQWRWELGNGVTSVLQNPSTTYFNPGTYAVKLVIRNAAGTADSITKTNYITVFPSPTPTFSADRTTGCFPLEINFTDASAPGVGTITNWVWDFGDGTTSTQQNPSHVYSAAGNYTVTLQVTNSSGCTRTFSRPQYIAVSNGVTADFTNINPGPCSAPSTVSFANVSTGPGPLSYEWNFGDGNTSTASNPTHTYTANGVYHVSLITTSPQGCRDTMLKTNLINIGMVNADFNSLDTVCVNSSITFSNLSTPVPMINAWSFGDGNVSSLLNPVVTYASPGTYSVKLVTDFGGCLDSVTKQIVVSARPQPQFTATPRTFCSLPATVSFTNQSTGSGSMLWNFGDGTTSTLLNPSHTYTAAGSYTVSLTITNGTGCSETVTLPNYIQIDTPQVALTGLPVNGCAPVTITPTALVTSNHNISSYSWNFGDGGTSNAATPSHTYTATGNYTVTLVYTTAEGCTDSVVMVNAVQVGTKPAANFSVNPTNVCAFQNVSFTDNSTGNVDQWLWTFGDGGSSTSQNPTYQYSDTGWFHVQLIVYNNTCPDTLRITNAVHIKPPIAAFSVQNNCDNKYRKTFVDGSVGATTWSWNFGDGNTSTLQNPVHTYGATGSYPVTLTVTNDTCSHSYTLTVRVIDEQANFTTADTIICRNQTASFVSAGINGSNITNWNWNFGDGSSANTDSAATHVYTSSGAYNVSLIITDLLGCSDTASRGITVYGPTANFTVSSPVSCLYNNSTTFTNLSTTDGTHPITKWTWNYGDGTIDSSSVSPAIHSYAAAGNYNVSLLVEDSYGCTGILNQPAGVIISQPDADFYSADTITCTGRPITFTNTSTGTGLQYAWTFGDGNISSVVNPIHNYGSIGTYSIGLTVTDQYGCVDSLAKPNYVAISFPQAMMMISDSVSTCPPLLVNFSHQSTDYTSLTWDFGDGTGSTVDSPSHFYTSAGTFDAILTVRGPGGCMDTAMKRIVISGPSGSFSYTPLTGCKPLTVNFTGVTQNNATYTWDFADGTIIVTTDSLISHTYVNAGEYVPKLILTDAGGCSVPITGIDTVRVTGIQTGFQLDSTKFCDEGSVQFINTTVGNDFITSYQWNFGDGTTSSAQNPVHDYSSPGIYTVSLLAISQSGCRNSLTLTDTIRIYASPVINIQHDSSGCVPVTVAFNGQVTSGDATTLKWLWNFGNGQTDTLQNPMAQIYSLPNAYAISAIATDVNGCKDTAAVQINAYPIPVVDAGTNGFVCEGSAAQLNASGATTYVWAPAGSLSCTNCPSPLAAPTDSTTYFVTGTTAFGCTAIDSVTIGVHHPFVLNVAEGDTVCSGSLVHLRATGADNYTWSPALSIANPNVGITTATPTTTTRYQVIARDNHNCFADTGYVNVFVWQYPTVNAGPDRTVSIGTSFTLQPSYSSDVTDYQWSNPSQSLSCVDCPTPTVQTKTANATYSIRVQNEGGCEARDEVTILAICNGANLFIPNTFSPNNDGKNEKFYPRGSGLTIIKSLRIYNRWGETVFSAVNVEPNDASAGWDGTYKGKALPPDVYVYTCEVVCLNNEVLIYHGNVTLLR